MGAGGRFVPPGGKIVGHGRVRTGRLVEDNLRGPRYLAGWRSGRGICRRYLDRDVCSIRRGWVEALLMRSTDVLFFHRDADRAEFCCGARTEFAKRRDRRGRRRDSVHARTCYPPRWSRGPSPILKPARWCWLRTAGFSAPLPNVLTTMIVIATLGVSTAIAAGLSFLGLVRSHRPRSGVTYRRSARLHQPRRG